jgi:hypothetical protein
MDRGAIALFRQQRLLEACILLQHNSPMFVGSNGGKDELLTLKLERLHKVSTDKLTGHATLHMVRNRVLIFIDCERSEVGIVSVALINRIGRNLFFRLGTPHCLS